jgi:hypothetical protein
MIEMRLDSGPDAIGKLMAEMRHQLRLVSVILLTSILAGCAAPPERESTTTTGDTSSQQYPDVVSAAVEVQNDGRYRFEVTISSPYDSPERYADAWRVLAPDGTQLAIRELLHDHASEQPFTRSLSGVELPEDIETVTVQGRDLDNGWGGATVDVTLKNITP